MGLAVAIVSIKCASCNSRSFSVERCQWCGKPFKGHSPRPPTEREQARKGGANGKANEQTYKRTPKRQDYNYGNDDLVRDMLRFVDEYNMTASRFSRLCTRGGDPNLFDRVTQGGNPRDKTKERIREFMNTYKTADIFD